MHNNDINYHCIPTNRNFACAEVTDKPAINFLRKTIEILCTLVQLVLWSVGDDGIRP